MVNRPRGEVAIEVNGQRLAMRLTLGALAELEERLAVGSIVALAERFESGSVASRDLIALLSAGLRGAGNPIGEEVLSEAEIGGGAIGALRAGIALMGSTFRPMEQE